MAQELIPYSINGMTNYPQQSSFVPALTRPGQACGIYIMLHPDAIDEVAARFTRWFAGRAEVSVVDVGTSDKVGAGFILMEWMECDIDQLFISILDDEESIADYTLYGRSLQEG